MGHDISRRGGWVVGTGVRPGEAKPLCVWKDGSRIRVLRGDLTIVDADQPLLKTSCSQKSRPQNQAEQLRFGLDRLNVELHPKTFTKWILFLLQSFYLQTTCNLEPMQRMSGIYLQHAPNVVRNKESERQSITGFEIMIFNAAQFT